MTTHTVSSPDTTVTLAGSQPNKSRERLARLRGRLVELGLDALVVRSTDRYLNEYVPQAESTREWLTGFTGSVGEVLVTASRAFLVVDGRYHLQADQQVDLQAWTVVKLPITEQPFTGVVNKVQELVVGGEIKRVGYEADRFTLQEKDALQRVMVVDGAAAVPVLPSPLETVRGGVVVGAGNLRVLDEARVGRTAAEKVAAVQEALKRANVDLFLVQRLDDVAYLSNLRADELPYQATFKGMAAVGREGALLCLHSRVAGAELVAARGAFSYVAERDLPEALRRVAGEGRKAGVDGSATTEAVRAMLEAAGFSVVPMANPLTEMKALKTSAELTRMAEAFRLADRVFAQVIRWTCRAVDKGERVTEADLAKKLEQSFKRSGALGLSFKTIAAAGKNGAIIHYSDPDPERVIQKGELVLLDAGAYYTDGYATDLTRTFLAGGPSVKADDTQRRLFTLTLKAAIAGMTATFPAGTPGISLDGITRKPLWDQGLTYNHGTGHGLGINVHELPPTVSMRAITPLHKGHVFSIEPGVYLADWGGIRIENLCTVEEVPDRPGWLRVKPLTFSPLDKRLVDAKLLTPAEKGFLKWFGQQHKQAPGDPA
jgi:Xaa-Pro aminopeptidase